jgi:hypothetical protein
MACERDISVPGPVKSPIQEISKALSSGVKLPGREANHSTASSAEVKMVELQPIPT